MMRTERKGPVEISREKTKELQGKLGLQTGVREGGP